MSEPSKELRANAPPWEPKEIPEVVAEEPPEVHPEEPVSTRFRISAQALGMSHGSETCDGEGHTFSKKINDFMKVPDQESAKLKIERCRDARIQETISYSTSCPMHIKLVDLHINLREAFEPPLPKDTLLLYINHPGASPPQYYLVQSPSPVLEAPWYGAQEIKVTNTDIEITENALNTDYSKLLSRYSFYERQVTLTWMRQFAMNNALHYIDSAKQSTSCYYMLESYLQQEYNKALYNHYVFNQFNPVPPSPPLPSTSSTSTGGRRKSRRRPLRSKQITRKKIGKRRFRKG